MYWEDSQSAGRFAGLLALVALALTLALTRLAVAGPRVVYVIPVRGEVDAGLAAFVDRSIGEAEKAGARALVLDIDTFGGRVDAAVLLRDRLLRTPVPTVAFIHPRAISAGALIALASERIAMSDGATIGAAAPITAAPGAAPQPAGEKMVSYLRKEFRATAEQRGRPPEIAEAMVDADVAIPGLVAEGKLLTLTTWEALAHGIADFRANDIAGVLGHLGLETAELRRPSPNWAERLVGFLAMPMVGSLLLSIGTLALLVAVRSPEFGVAGIVGVACLALFFWARWLLRLVGWEEMALILTGSALLALEVFVIPGFGVAGVFGVILLFLGLTLNLVGQGVTPRALLDAVGQIALAAVLVLAGSIALLRVLPRLPFGRRIVLSTELSEGGGEARPSRGVPIQPGTRGIALSPLRPAGVADIQGARTDVVSEGEYVPSGEPIEVIRMDENRIVVRRAPPSRGQVG